MLSVGIDLVEIRRIEKSIRNPRFCSRVLGKTEYAQLEMRGFPVQSVAASFCAKEAFSKALGTGIRGFALTEVELLREENGRPRLHLTGNAAKLAAARGLAEFSVSVTHTKEYAAAVVVGEERD
ncbi:MAG TPA: holo-ACP synthase [Candidatus Gallacutalibacter pullicola]|uniref:Holo-[acyl-carrier-protein] synthase n=1 Tax=Candidatus Gallacutalibacter pullicola TaxID=2840830 RepID=A0A9D1J168_9FIRM|nr:holo-ACP synthase [Candidatus Gallacutalibacter pullicola]